MVAIEVGRALLELSEVLHRLEGALRPEEALDIHAAECRRIDPVPELLRPDVPDQVRGPVGVAVHVAIKAGHPDHPVGAIRPPVLGRIELLLGELRDQKAQTFELLRVQETVESLVVILERDHPSLRDIAKIRARRQEDRRGPVGQNVLREVEIQIEAREARQDVDRHLGEEHAAFSVIREREGRIRKERFLLDLVGSHLVELLPRGAAQAGRRTDRHGLSP